MALVWMTVCKTCLQPFAVLPRESVPGKSTDALVPHQDAGLFKCPHCHEKDRYSTDDLYPGEGRIH